MGHLVDEGSKLSTVEIDQIAKLFMRPDLQPRESPPFCHVWFNEAGKFIIDMISYVLGFKTSEYVDETILVLMSMFILGHLPAIKFDFATFISNKIHDKFIKLDREGVFKYTSYISHLFLYYQTYSFQCPIRKLDTKGERRSMIFWTSVFHEVHNSPYTYCEFIDLFIHPFSSLLMRTPPPRLSGDMQKILQHSKNYKIGH